MNSCAGRGDMSGGQERDDEKGEGMGMGWGKGGGCRDGMKKWGKGKEWGGGKRRGMGNWVSVGRWRWGWEQE